MDGRTDRNTKRRLDRHSGDGQIIIKADKQTDTRVRMDGWTDGRTDRWTVRQIEKKDKQTNRQTMK